MKILKLFHNKKGFTLIELLVVLAIMGIVISMAFSIQTFGTKTSSKGQNKSNAQYNVRMAAAYITKEIRNADTVEILSAMPAIRDPQKKYIYVEGSTIKHYIGGLEKDIIKEPSADFTPVMTFDKNASDGRILNFTIRGTYKGEQFNVTSEILPMNMASGGSIMGTSGGSVISFGPFTDAEVVNVDKILLNLKNNNLFLHQEADGSLTLNPPPDPSVLMLPANGVNNSAITWRSMDAAVIRDSGVVIRPGISAGDKITTLRATLSKGTESTTKDFIIKVCDMDPLTISNAAPTAATSGSAYEYTFTASGGDAAYSFSTPDSSTLSSRGLTLNATGRLSGTPTAAGSITFALVVVDGSGNSTSTSVTLTIN